MQASRLIPTRYPPFPWMEPASPWDRGAPWEDADGEEDAANDREWVFGADFQ